MSEPILDPGYWAGRLASAAEEHQAIFRCPLATWREIEQRHREILAGLILPGDSVLDVGCGWGRLIDLMPQEWVGTYAGVDICPEFVRLARERHGRRGIFVNYEAVDVVGTMAEGFPQYGAKFDWAIMVSFRPMVRRNLGDEYWNELETEIRKSASKLLYLEYDAQDNGSVE